MFIKHKKKINFTLILPLISIIIFEFILGIIIFTVTLNANIFAYVFNKYISLKLFILKKKEIYISKAKINLKNFQMDKLKIISDIINDK